MLPRSLRRETSWKTMLASARSTPLDFRTNFLGTLSMVRAFAPVLERAAPERPRTTFS
jgi:hypothetical protein